MSALGSMLSKKDFAQRPAVATRWKLPISSDPLRTTKSSADGGGSRPG